MPEIDQTNNTVKYITLLINETNISDTVCKTGEFGKRNFVLYKLLSIVLGSIPMSNTKCHFTNDSDRI